MLNSPRRFRKLITPLRLTVALVAAAAGSVAVQAEPLAAAQAENKRESEQRLQQLRRQIGNISEYLERQRVERSAAQQQLAVVERDLSRKSSRLRQVRGELADTSKRLKALEAKQQQTAEQLANQREALRGSLQSAWMAGRNQELKLLLNQESSAEFGRMLTYYRYVNAARGQSISNYKQQLVSFSNVQQQLAETQQNLASQLGLAEQLVEELEADRQSRAVALADIERELRQQGGQLSSLQAEANQLTNLLSRLQNALRSVPARPSTPAPSQPDIGGPVVMPDNQSRTIPPSYSRRGPRTAFRKLRGALPWPSDGQLRPPEFKRLKGVLITADRGATVRAVAHGEVVFADWLQHFGMLVVVDHDNGYMSLYGHNEALLVNVGDQVNEDTALARVGDSGGRDRAALYFELRHNRKTLSPQRWLARRG